MVKADYGGDQRKGHRPASQASKYNSGSHLLSGPSLTAVDGHLQVRRYYFPENLKRKTTPHLLYCTVGLVPLT